MTFESISAALHGTKIDYDSISKFPNRDKFLNANDIEEDKCILNRGKPINFLPNDVVEKHIKDGNRLSYKIVMSGIAPSGKKMIVELSERPYFLVRVPDKYLGLDILDTNLPENVYHKVEKFKDGIKSIFEDKKIYSDIDGWTIERLFHHTGFQIIKGFYIKLVFFTLYQRRNAIKLISLEANKDQAAHTTAILGHYCNTAHDDLTYYYRVTCRDYQWNLCGWNKILKYEIKKPSYGTVEDDVIYISCDVYHFKPAEAVGDLMKMDRTMILSWDIECSRGSNDGNLPDALEEKDEVFMIGITYGRYWDDIPLLRIAITSLPCNARDNDVTIVCNSERELIMAFPQIINKLKPDIIVGFNDGDFDWKFVAEKARFYLLLEYYKELMSIIYEPTTISSKDLLSLQSIYKRNPSNLEKLKFISDRMLGTHHRGNKVQGLEFTHYIIKLDAETNIDTYALKFFGYVPIDVRCKFRILYSNPEESSLAYFLQDNNLGSKEDMPIVELFDIYNNMNAAKINNDIARIEELSESMARIKSYCIRDAEACHLLMGKRNIVMDSRAISIMAHTSFQDAIIRANGMKVRNMLICKAAERGIAYTNINLNKHLEDKYPGAYVVPPKKGMYISKLSVRERVQAAKNDVVFPYNGDKSYFDWKDLTEGDIVLLEQHIFNSLSDKDESQCAVADLQQHTRSLMPQSIVSNLHQSITSLQQFAVADLLHHLEPLFKSFMAERILRPLSGLDFSSLYPSIMMALNLSKETIIRPDYSRPDGIEVFEAQANRLRSMGYKLHKIEFPYGPEGHKRTIMGYSIRHTYNPDDVKSDPALSGFGIFPTILHKIFKDRIEVKKQMKDAAKIIERTEKEVEHLSADITNATKIAEIYSSPEYREVKFKFAYYQSIQLALKVFMNTFYGESGNQMSPMFMLELAGGITTAGQYNIKLVIETVKSLGGDVAYGDTDSAYVSCPDHIYRDIDALYYGGKMTKKDYWTSTVEKTFVEIEKIKQKVNSVICADNGTNFLKTAYEEVLYPVALLAKKKYFGIAHEGIVNFKPTTLFNKGLDMKKRGMPDILKKVCGDIMWESVDIDQLKSLRNIVQDTIAIIYNTKWPLHSFVCTKSYKPKKQNVGVNTFVRRMKEENDIIIRPVERFEFVYVKKYPYKFDIAGRTTRLQQGDRMELVDIAEKKGLEIDMDIYMSSIMVGQLARLIAYHHDFDVENEIKVTHDDHDVDDNDRHVMDAAKHHITELCSRHTIEHPNPYRVYQKLYKTANKCFDEKLKTIGGHEVIDNIKSDLISDIYTRLNAEVHVESLEYANNLVERLLKEEDIFEIKLRYVGNKNTRGSCDMGIEILDIAIEKVKQDLDSVLVRNKFVINIRETALQDIVNTFKYAANVDYDDEKIIEHLTAFLNDNGIKICTDKAEDYIGHFKKYENDIILMNSLYNSLKSKLMHRKRLVEVKNKIINVFNGKIGSEPITFNKQKFIEEALIESTFVPDAFI